MEEAEMKIIKALEGDNFGKTFTEIAEITGLAYNQVSACISKLIEQGVVETREFQAGIIVYRLKSF